MTNLEAAALLVELLAECETSLRHNGKTLGRSFSEAVAMACMALREEDNND